MEKKSRKYDIKKLEDKDYKEFFKSISGCLGDNNIFARYDVGNGYYQWKDTRHEWLQMIAGDDIIQTRVRTEIEKQKKRINALLNNPQDTEILFTYPDDSYVYYYLNNDDIHILITGWGFKKPVRRVGSPDSGKIKINQQITVGFEYDGVKQPNYDFTLALDSQKKQFSTNADGVCSFPAKIGATFTLNANDKNYELNIVEGKSDYVFDITDYVDVTFEATENGNPITGETIDVNYNSQSYQCQTDSQGHSTLKLAYHKDNNIEARLRDKTENATISPSSNNICFIFQDEIPAPISDPISEPIHEPDPEPNPDLEPIILNIEIKDKNEQPMKCEKVCFKQGDKIQERVLDEEGRCTLLNDDFSIDEPIETEIVYDEKNNSSDKFSWQLVEDETHYILQEREIEKTKWWHILGQILFVLLCILIALFGLLIVLCY